MSFNYEYRGLQKVADFFDELAADVQDARRWVVDKTDIDFGEGLLNLITSGHEDVRTTVSDHMDGFAKEVLETAAKEFRDADNLYRVTDDQAAKEIDSAWSDVDVGAAREGVDARFEAAGKAFQVVTKAEDFPELDDFSDEFKQKPDWAWNFSAMGQARILLYKGTELASQHGYLDSPIDPYEYVLKPVFGNWTGFRECAQVYDILYKHYEEYANKIAEAGEALDGIWTGSAADAAKEWLYRLSAYCTQVAGDLEELAKQYKDSAMECYDLAQNVGPPCLEALEHTILAFAAANASAGSSATIVGIPVGTVLGAGAIIEAALVGQKMTDVLSNLGILKNTLSSTSSAVGGLGIVSAANLKLGGGMDIEVPNLPDEQQQTPS